MNNYRDIAGSLLAGGPLFVCVLVFSWYVNISLDPPNPIATVPMVLWGTGAILCLASLISMAMTVISARRLVAALSGVRIVCAAQVLIVVVDWLTFVVLRGEPDIMGWGTAHIRLSVIAFAAYVSFAVVAGKISGYLSEGIAVIQGRSRGAGNG